MILNTDAISGLQQLDDNSINCVVTSPPYYKLRDYQCGEKEIGKEQTIDEYINNLCDIFAVVKRVLRDDGTAFINIGDSYHNKSLMLIPQRLQIELTNRGWLIRNAINWIKPNVVPQSARDRYTNDYEVVIFATKSKEYFFNQQFEPHKSPKRDYRFEVQNDNLKNLNIPGQNQNTMHKKGWIQNPRGRNARTSWIINSTHFADAHFATFPQELVRKCLDAGCPKNGIVLDPFAGSGTTAVVAEQMGIEFKMIELNSEYCQLMKRRLSESEKV